jgi:hypothetical protein
MSVSPRLAAVLLVPICALTGPPLASAEKTPGQRADELNTEGKEEFRKGNYEPAAERFRQAIVLSPEGRFYFNLCYTLDRMGRPHEALTACQAVAPNGASEPLRQKADALAAQIKARLDGQGGSNQTTQPPQDGTTGGGPPAGGDPSAGGPGGSGTTGTIAPPGSHATPTAQVSAGVKPVHDYSWGLGIKLGPLRNLRVGARDNYAPMGAYVRLFADFTVMQSRRVGLQAYLGFSSLDEADRADAMIDSISITDLGGAIYQNRPLLGNLYWTPLVGLHAAFIQPNEWSNEALVTAGLRGELSLDWVLTGSGRHVLSFTPVALNVYLPATKATATVKPEDSGLDRTSVAWTITLGYTLRFTNPFGTGPLITLE